MNRLDAVCENCRQPLPTSRHQRFCSRRCKELVYHTPEVLRMSRLDDIRRCVESGEAHAPDDLRDLLAVVGTALEFVREWEMAAEASRDLGKPNPASDRISVQKAAAAVRTALFLAESPSDHSEAQR